MKNEDAFSTDFQKTVKCLQFIGLPKTGFVAKIGKQMKIIIFVGSLGGTGLLMNSCSAGYVATEPVYTEYSRPERPTEHHVWVDDNWVYDRQTNVYVQHNGYWSKPHQNQSYRSGQWQSTPRGKYWEKGHWERNDHQEKRHNRR